MSTSTKVDQSTLGWVTAEIDQTLSEAQSALASYADSSGDATPLRMFVGHVHQVLGTLQMVELDSASMLAQEIESVAEALLNKKINDSKELLDLLPRGLEQLSSYLDRLKAGRPEVPVKLIPILNELRRARGEEELSEFALFLPDLSVYPPSNRNKEKLSDQEYGELVRSLRRDYQAFLLRWLRDMDDLDAISAITEILDRLAGVARFGSVAQLWWVGAAYVEAISQKALDADNERKKVIGRLDQQVRRLLDGGEAALIRDPADELVNEMLFALAHATGTGPRMSIVRTAFELDSMLSDDSADGDLAFPSASELREFGNQVEEELTDAQQLLSDYFAEDRIGSRNMGPVMAKLDSLYGQMQEGSLAPLQRLTGQVKIACMALENGQVKDLERASLKLAGALLLVEKSFKGLLQPGPDWQEQIDVSVAGLRALGPGVHVAGDDTLVEGIEFSEAALTEAEFKQLLAVVASEIRVNLAQVEESLEAFAGRQSELELLKPVPQHLSQVQGALQILGQSRAAELVSVANQYVQDIQEQDLHVDAGVMEALAVAVGSIQAYVEGLEEDRGNLDLLISRAMQYLDDAVTELRIGQIDPIASIQSIGENLEAWLLDSANYRAYRAMRQSLRDIASLAERHGVTKAHQIAMEMNNLLDIVTEDSSFLSQEVTNTLHRSLDSLSVLKNDLPELKIITPETPGAGDYAAATAGQSGTMLPPTSISADPGLDAEILDIFIEEARDCVTQMAEYLQAWSDNLTDDSALTELRRQFHTLKGSGRIAGAMAIAELAWIVEELLNKVIAGNVEPVPEMVDLVRQVHSTMAEVVAREDAGTATLDLDLWRDRVQAFVGETVETGIGSTSAEFPGAPAQGTPLPAGGVNDDTVFKIFTKEALGHLSTIRDYVSECRAKAGDNEFSPELLRAAHTLRGSARSLDLTAMAEVYEQLENFLEAMQHRSIKLDETDLALLDQAHYLTARLLDRLSESSSVSPELELEFQALRDAIGNRFDTVFSPGSGLGTTVEHAPATPPDGLVPGLSESAAAADAGEFDDDLDLLEIFCEEAADILHRIDSGLGKWRTGDTVPDQIKALKRELHTLKGSARAAGAQLIGDLSHNTETLLERLDEGAIELTPQVLSVLEEVHDTLVSLVRQLEGRQPLSAIDEINARLSGLLGGKLFSESEPDLGDVSELFPPQESPLPAPMPLPAVAEAAMEQPLPAVAAQGGAVAGGIVESAVATAMDQFNFVRVRTDHLDNLVNYAGEVAIARSRMQQQIGGLRDNLSELHGNVRRFREQLRELEIQAESQILSRRHDVEQSRASDDFDPLELDRFSRLQGLSRTLSESLDDLVTIQGGLVEFAGDAENVLQQQAHLSTELQDGLMRTRMVAFSTQVPRLRHFVRKTARQLGKSADLDISGADVEIDRNVLEQMMGSFEHMLRNALDHGIESAPERKHLGKPEGGRLKLSCAQEGNEIVIKISDDGRGLDLDRIRKKAIDAGLIKTGSRLTDQEMMQLIVVAGFSTAERVTQVSGRGVGMDVVHTMVKRLGGSINTESAPNKGTTFVIRLPISLAITHALLVRVAEQAFAIPLAVIQTVIKVDSKDLNRLTQGEESLFEYQGKVYSVLRLADRLGIRSQAPPPERVPILLVRMGTRDVAVQVDNLYGTQEVVVKTVGAQLAEVEGIAGATILGDGSVVIILDLAELWLSQEVTLPVQRMKMGAKSELAAPRLPTVMVVDDSLTVRKVTKRSLQKHGFEVLMAKDGLDALEQLRDHRPDAMLVDIEMPRMDGYELTSQVRSDPGMRDIPIIIITSRSGDKHRQKAMELGATAYLTKPYQEDELLANLNAVIDLTGSGSATVH